MKCTHEVHLLIFSYLKIRIECQKFRQIDQCYLAPLRYFVFWLDLVQGYIHIRFAHDAHVLYLKIACIRNVKPWVPTVLWNGGSLGANTPLTPDRSQVERPPSSLQITLHFLVFYGLSHGTTFKKKDVAVF